MIREAIAVISGGMKFRRYLKACRLSDDPDAEPADRKSDPPDTFNYKGGRYDREKFTELVSREFEKLSERDILLGAKEIAENIDRSSNRGLDMAYIEAYRRAALRKGII